MSGVSEDTLDEWYASLGVTGLTPAAWSLLRAVARGDTGAPGGVRGWLRTRAYRRRLPEFLALGDERCGEMRDMIARVRTPEELALLWQGPVGGYLHLAAGMVRASKAGEYPGDHRRLEIAAPGCGEDAPGDGVWGEVERAFGVFRAYWLRAGELSGHGGDLFFLPQEELSWVLCGDEEVLAAVPQRRAAYEGRAR